LVFLCFTPQEYRQFVSVTISATKPFHPSKKRETNDSILRTFFERKGVTKKATPCLNVSAQLHFK
jgi:hypothetical protein